jgi:hypothetical protein
VSDEAFAKLVSTLAPWNSSLVYVGGWAFRLFRHHPAASIPDYAPLTTRDADVAFPDAAALEGNIKAALTTAGFKEDLFGQHKPPVSHYALGEEGSLGFYAEFLTPLRGSGYKRGGRLDATTMAAGVTAQKLRHLDVLMIDPWSVVVGAEQGLPLAEGTRLQVPNPATFIAQKILIHELRDRDKKAQDLLYIHDTLELFGSKLEELNQRWRAEMVPALPPGTNDSVTTAINAHFHELSDTFRDAAQIPQDRVLDPPTMHARFLHGLEVLFQA